MLSTAGSVSATVQDLKMAANLSAIRQPAMPVLLNERGIFFPFTGIFVLFSH